mmetsp:Transcript_33768/g.86518  ORF Transcript_33768/g.86518 Transcript_33768/m.86518 type:complete len:238 (-) Transcript_33768:154-867(-)
MLLRRLVRLALQELRSLRELARRFLRRLALSGRALRAPLLQLALELEPLLLELAQGLFLRLLSGAELLEGRARLLPRSLQVPRPLGELLLREVRPLELRAAFLPQRLHVPLERILRGLVRLDGRLQLLRVLLASLHLMLRGREVAPQALADGALRGEARGEVVQAAVELRLCRVNGTAHCGAPPALFRKRFLETLVQLRELCHALLVVELAVHGLGFQERCKVLGITQRTTQQLHEV